MDYEPKVLGFACNWCGYAGADQAGAAKIEYPPNIRIARVMCMGRVDQTLVLEAFLRGFDGVLLTGCHVGDCHYVSGNILTYENMARFRGSLDIIGLGAARLRVEEVSASEGPRFAREVGEFVAELRQLGPSPYRAAGALEAERNNDAAL